MKQANNNEVDLLLRSLAKGRDERSQSASMSGDGQQAVSDHLDADELNSYAEGVVPAAARTRYSSHLADCEQCRGIVIGLTQAAGAVTSYESLEPQRGSSFWQKLAALFSLQVLRYAVPALALAGAIGISLLALRQHQGREMTAQNEPAAVTSTSSDRHEQYDSARNLKAATPPPGQKTLEPGTTADPGKPKTNLQDEKAGNAEGPASDFNFAIAPKVKDATPSGQASGEIQTKPVYGLEPKAPAPPPASTALSEADKSAGIAKEQPPKREDRDEQERRRDLYMNAPSDEHGPNRSAAPRSAAPQGGRQAEGVMTTRGSSDSDKRDKVGEAEATTTVAGRHFKHEGNAWVDTAYESSRATINVARGSEQYRALIADEPGLRTIAEQLRGVVIVVWKNRAYRIQ